ncbi:hypothetical protein N9U88_00770 [Candidatus Pelagibacter sp.]|nr:hypothetical protein [Candidatus Pelagibacter sp.]
MRSLFIYISFFFFITTKVYSDVSKKIIDNLENANNFGFKFAQQINQNKETGYCILVFNGKINCKYDNSGKILVSDGKNLIVKNKNSNIPNFYKLENTSFYKILDKQYLINQIKKNSIKSESGRLFTNLNYQNTDIEIFFDKEKLQIKGWKTTDIYNNSVSTEITISEINKVINENIFDLKKFN